MNIITSIAESLNYFELSANYNTMNEEVDYKKLFLQLANASDPLLLESVISSSDKNLTSEKVFADIWRSEEPNPLKPYANVPDDPASLNELSDKSSKSTTNSTSNKLSNVTSSNEEISKRDLDLVEHKLNNLESSLKIRKKISRTEELCKIRMKQLRYLLKESSHVDIAFLVDCTRSMSAYISQVKHTVQNIVKEIYNKFENNIRLAFVGYRDHSDGMKRIERLNFSSLEDFITFVENIVVSGGGDIPEDVLGGLESAIDLDWLSKNKIIFHMGDAPQHGRDYHNLPSSKDDYYRGDPRGIDTDSLFKSLKEMNIKYFFGKIKPSTDKMIERFKLHGGDNIVTVVDMNNPDLLEKMVVLSVTETIEDSQLLTVDLFSSSRDSSPFVPSKDKNDDFPPSDSDLSGFKETRDDVLTSVDLYLYRSRSSSSLNPCMSKYRSRSKSSFSYRRTKSVTGGESGRSLKEYSVHNSEPRDDEIKCELCVSWLDCTIPRELPYKEVLVQPNCNMARVDMKSHIVAINHSWSHDVKLKKGEHPFAEGQQRISYHGVKGDRRVVLKEFKYFGEGRDRREDYIQIMETQAIAGFMAAEFNKVSPKGSKIIHFLKVNVVQHYLENRFPVYYNVETLIPEYKNGFVKWNNNTGRVSRKVYSPLLDAFSHWTYDVTNGFLLIVDIQGVERDDCFILTDPAINCVEQRFGGTNIGEVGAELFFAMHECSDVCLSMGLRKNRHMKDVKDIYACITGGR